MRSHVPLLVGLALIAGLSVGCSNSDNGSIGAEEGVLSVSDQLTQEESSLIASAETEATSESHPASLETD